MSNESIPEGGYEGIDVSLWEEVTRRISTARAREQHEQNRLMKHLEKNPAVREKIDKLRDITEKRIQRILTWAQEQSTR